MVEMLAVRYERGPQVEYFLEGFLHRWNFLTNCRFAPQFPLEIGGRTDVIGVCMRFENPFRRQSLIHDKRYQFICASSTCSARFGIVIKDRINNRAASVWLVVNDIADCP